MRWFIGAVAAMVMLAGGVLVGVATSPMLQDRIIRRVVEENLSRDPSEIFADDALRVMLCGTSAPLPDPRRAKSCTMVMAGGKYYLVDIGPESTETIMRSGIPVERVAGVFLTHFHSDHIGELGELNFMSWAQGRAQKLPVYGAAGVGEVVAGFLRAYRLDQGYRTAHHGSDLMPPETWEMLASEIIFEAGFGVPGARTGLAFKDGELTVTALEVQHSPVEPALAYRFDYKGRSVVVSGDTAKHLPLAKFAKDSDILVHEAQAHHLVEIMRDAALGIPSAKRRALIFNDILSYHSSPVEAAEIANAAGVKLLVLTHFTPPPNNLIARIAFTRGLEGAREGEWDFGADGRLYELPLGSSDIRISDLDLD